MDALSMLVANYWPGVRLRVIDAWDEDGLHPPDSLHYEGRAVDITTSDRDRGKYGMLARLAAQAGFDWVDYEVKSHVHASVKSDTVTRHKRSLRCFPENATVITQSYQRVPISSLKLNDYVMTLSVADNAIGPTFEPVIANLHIDPNAVNDFILITTRNNTQLTVSGDHLLYILNVTKKIDHFVDSNRLIPIFAKGLSIDNYLLVFNGKINNFLPEKIGSLKTVHARGLYAPLTVSGTIIVDNIAASCYAGVVSMETAHVAMAPVRLWHSAKTLFPRFFNFINNNIGVLSYNTDGINLYAYFLQKLANLLENLNIASLLIE